MKKANTNLTSLAGHLYTHGKGGTPAREKFEEEFEAIRLGITIRELRKERGLTQGQLAVKCGLSKAHISRIENNACDIRLSTLMRIIRDGLDGHLKLSVNR